MTARVVPLMAMLTTLWGGVAQANTDYSLRIGTINAGMLAPPTEVGCPNNFAIPWPGGTCFNPDWYYGVGCGYFVPLGGPQGGYCEPGKHPVYDEDAIRWGARDLAERIIKSGYDVIAIQELWWDEAEEHLRADLRDHYPYYVLNISDEMTPFPWVDINLHDVFEQGSGLAVFSKLPFLPVAGGLDDYRNDRFDIGINSQDYNCPDDGGSECQLYFAFLEFDDESGPEEHAEKGVGHVRVVNLDTGRRHNIFFTHMQATYADKHEEDFWHGYDDRTSQFNELKAFIEAAQTGSLPIYWQNEDVFVLGDFNVDGDRSNPYFSLDPPYEDNIHEWMSRFGSNAFHDGFFAGIDEPHALHDMWDDESPLAGLWYPDWEDDLDYGHTASLGSNVPTRLDYILTNVGVVEQTDIEPLCNQHPHLATNLLSGEPLMAQGGPNPPGGRGDLSDGEAGQFASVFQSDHLGVNANYNRLAPHCAPVMDWQATHLYGDEGYGARVLSAPEVGNKPAATMFDEVKNDPALKGKLLEGTLEYPGSVQWYFLPYDGSYLIGFDETSHDLGYRLQVYQAKDLSRPYKAYGSTTWPEEVGQDPVDTILGQKYDFEGGPFFIKVYHPRHDHRALPGNSSGDYTFAVNRLGCTNKEGDACLVFPNRKPKEYEFAAGLIESVPTHHSFYFELAVESFTVPAPQNVAFHVVDYDTDLLETSIVDPDAVDPDDENADRPEEIGGQTLERKGFYGGGASGFLCPPSSGCEMRLEAEIPGFQGQSQRFVWRVHRAGAPDPQAFSVAWDTELTVAYGGGYTNTMSQSLLRCIDKTNDGSPRDEIDVKVKVDGTQMTDFQFSGVKRFPLGKFRSGRDRAVDAVYYRLQWPWRFKESLEIELIEEDELSDDRHKQSKGPLEWGRGPNSFEQKPEFIWKFANGDYRQWVLMSHGLQNHSAD